MNRLYVCGSFKYAQQMRQLEDRLREENVEYQMSEEIDSLGILGCLKRIDDADVIYVVDPEGYVGKSVCVDIGYAYARNKSIYVMSSIADPSFMGMISGVLSFEELISFLRQDHAHKT